jgi:hypothetical protein
MVVREFLRIQDFLIYRDGFLFKDWCQYVINMSLCWGLYLKNDAALQYVIYNQSCEASSFNFDDLENLISSTDFVEL